MKKYLLIILILFTVQIFAQEIEEPIENLPESKVSMQTIETLKTAYITKELNLSPDEAQKFWPTYNNFIGELKKARMEYKGDVVAFEERKIIILKKYKDDFKRILNNDNRVKKCFSAAPEFHKFLRNEWKRRQEIKRGGGMSNNKPPIHSQNGGGAGKLSNRPPHK